MVSNEINIVVCVCVCLHSAAGMSMMNEEKIQILCSHREI